MVTMREVAAQAGVSYTTVSYVLNKGEAGRRISSETSKRVTETATSLGYRHNAVARAMVEGGQRVIGLLTQDVALETRAQILAGVIEEANRCGYLVKVFPLTSNSVPAETLNTCLEQRLCGAIAVNIHADSIHQVHEEFSRFGVALAMVDDVSPQSWGVRVVSDDEAGVHLALQYLWDLGHRRFAFAAGPVDSEVTAVRRRAYADFMNQHELDGGPVIDAAPRWDFRDEDEAKLCATLLDSSRPTAVFCVSDYLAMRVLRVARGLGLDVPRDLSVVGYSDLLVASYADPPLTTVSQPFRLMGTLAAKHIVERVETVRAKSSGGAEFARQIFNEPLNVALPTCLVVRDSTAPPTSNLTNQI